VTIADLNAVHALSADEAWAVGGTAIHRTASGWTVKNARAGGGTIEDSKGPLVAVFAVSSNDVWAGTPYGMVHWDGTEWSSFGYAEGGALSGVQSLSATGPKDVWAVTGAGIAHWDGDGWNAVPTLDDAGSPLAPTLWRIFARAPNDVWAGGPFNLIHYDGTRWTKVGDGSIGPPLFGPVTGIWSFSPTDAWFATGLGVGGTGPLVAFHFTGSSYAAVPVPGDFRESATFPTFAASGPNDLTFFARGGIAHWNGTAWSYDDRPAADLESASSAGGVTYVVGASGAILRKAP
jgi:hypothetical protein